MSFVRMIQESLSGSYKNLCPDNSRMFVRVLQECCPDVARIITMNTKVFYESWQMECCGKPFKIGDPVEWYVVSADRLTGTFDIDGLEYAYDAQLDLDYTFRGKKPLIHLMYQTCKRLY